MFKITYLWARNEVNDELNKQLPKDQKVSFVEIQDLKDIDIDNIDKVIGKQYTPNQAINELIKELDLQEGNIYLTRLDTDDLLVKAKQIAILSYSDYVNRVNTKLSITIAEGQPYSEFIKLIKADKVPGTSLKDLVDVKGYWQTVYRTNLSTIFQGGYLDQVAELKEDIAFETWNSINAEDEQCSKLTGVTAKVGEFEANGNVIPSQYNCTAYLTITSKVRAGAFNIKTTKGWDRSAKPARGFQSKTTAKKTSTLPKTVTNRLPSGYTRLM